MESARYAGPMQELMCRISQPQKDEWRYRSHEFPFEGLAYRLAAIKLARRNSLLLFLFARGPSDPGPFRIVRWKVGVRTYSIAGRRWIRTGRSGIRDANPEWRLVVGWACPRSELRVGRGPLVLVLRLSEKRFWIPTEWEAINIDLSALSNNVNPISSRGRECDVTIRVKDEAFRAHWDVLASRSPVLAAMSSCGMEESQTGLISVDDCEPEDFRILLQFVYCGTVDSLSPENVMGAYYAADKYGVLELKDVCVHFILSKLTVRCICDVFRLALRHNDKVLLRRGTEFFARNAIEILASRQWGRLAREHPIYVRGICAESVRML